MIGIVSGSAGRWVCLEPDPCLLDQLRLKLGPAASRNYEMICGTVRTIDRAWQFDTIIYIDWSTSRMIAKN